MTPTNNLVDTKQETKINTKIYVVTAVIGSLALGMAFMGTMTVLNNDSKITGTEKVNCISLTDGMEISDSMVNLTVCPGTYNLDNGITISGNSVTLSCNNEVTLNRTLIRGEEFKGINIQGDNNQILGCHLEGYNTAILVNGKETTIEDNTIIGGSTYEEYYGVTAGIDVHNSGNTFAHNNLSKVYSGFQNDSGIWGDPYDGTNSYYNRNTVSDCYFGIRAVLSILVNNTISNCNEGYDLFHGNTAYGNTAKDIFRINSEGDPFGTGFRLSSSNTIFGNSISNSGDNGIEIYGEEGPHIGSGLSRGNNNEIISNTIEGNTTNGIFIGKGLGNNTIQSNTISDNGEDGIVLAFTKDNTIQNNNIVDNAEFGIYFASTYVYQQVGGPYIYSPLLENNIIANNATGIGFEDTLNATVTSNNNYLCTNTTVDLSCGHETPSEYEFSFTSTDDSCDALVGACGFDSCASTCPTCENFESYTCADVNLDGTVDVADAVYMVDALFKGGPQPLLECSADVNGEDGFNVADIVVMVDYLFRGGPEPTCQASGEKSTESMTETEIDTFIQDYYQDLSEQKRKEILEEIK